MFDAQGDLLILSPPPGDRDRAWDTIIIVEHKGVYRARQVAVKKKGAAARQPAKVTQEATL